MHPRPLNSVQDVYIWTHLMNYIMSHHVNTVGRDVFVMSTAQIAWVGSVGAQAESCLKQSFSPNSGHLLNLLLGQVINPYFPI